MHGDVRYIPGCVVLNQDAGRQRVARIGCGHGYDDRWPDLDLVQPVILSELILPLNMLSERSVLHGCTEVTPPGA
jgi:hypothetical protein